MEIPEFILEKACKTGCRYFDEGECPFRFDEKDTCPRVKDVIGIGDVDV